MVSSFDRLASGLLTLSVPFSSSTLSGTFCVGSILSQSVRTLMPGGMLSSEEQSSAGFILRSTHSSEDQMPRLKSDRRILPRRCLVRIIPVMSSTSDLRKRGTLLRGAPRLEQVTVLRSGKHKQDPEPQGLNSVSCPKDNKVNRVLNIVPSIRIIAVENSGEQSPTSVKIELDLVLPFDDQS